MTDHPASEHPDDESHMTLKSRNVNARPEVIPKDFGSIHAGRIMVGIEWETQTVTLTLLTDHYIPKIDEFHGGWILDSIKWEVVGEVKIPIAAFNLTTAYYLHMVGNGFDVVNSLNAYLAKHPRKDTGGGVSYGPLDFKTEDVKKPDAQPKPQ